MQDIYLDLVTEEIIVEVYTGSEIPLDVYITETGQKGDSPAYEWDGTSIRFQNPDGTFGDYVNLSPDLTPITNTYDRVFADQKLSETIPLKTFAQTLNGYGYLDIAGANGQVSAIVEGNTYTQLIVNGDFRNGTTGWIAEVSTLTVASGIATNTANGTAAYGRFTQFDSNIGIKQNDVILTIAKYRVNNADCTQLNLLLRNNSVSPLQTSSIVSAPTQNVWYRQASLITATGDYTNGLRVYVNQQYANAATANGKVMEVDYVMVFNLTAMGLAHITDVPTLDRMFANYIDGTKHTFSDGGVLECTGKNLFDATRIEKGRLSSTGNIENASFVSNLYFDNEKIYWTQESLAGFVTDFIPVTQNTDYGFKYIGTPGANRLFRRVLYDNNKQVISYAESVNPANNFLIFNSSSAVYVRISFHRGVAGSYEGQFYFIEGNQETPYEPYRSSRVCFPALSNKSVPNGTQDKTEYVWESGTWRDTQNVSDEYVLQSADIVFLTTSGTYIDRVRISKPLDYILYDKANVGGSDGTMVLNGSVSMKDWSPTLDSLENINSLANTANLEVSYCVAKGTYANLEAAQSALVGLSLTYQLAVPVITDITSDVQGSLQAYPSGSINSYPAKCAYTLTASTEVTGATGVERVLRFDYVNGKVVDTDVTADCSIVGNDLVIANFVDGATYHYILLTDTSTSTVPELTAEVGQDFGTASRNYGGLTTAWTLTDNENKASSLVTTNAGGAVQAIANPFAGQEVIVDNTCGHTLTLKTASTAGVAVLNNTVRKAVWTGTAYKFIT